MKQSIKIKLISLLLCISLIVLYMPIKSYARTALNNLDKDVTNQQSFAEYMDLNLTGESIVNWIESNANSGLKYNEAQFKGWNYSNWWKCYNISDSGYQLAGKQSSAGYNCTGFAWSVYYYTHWKNEGYYKNGYNSKSNAMKKFIGELYGPFTGEKEKDYDLSNTGWFAIWANKNASKINHYHWTNLKNDTEVQNALTIAENKDQIHAGDLIIYWNDTQSHDIHTAIYAGKGYQYEFKYGTSCIKHKAGACSYNTSVYVFPLKKVIKTGWQQNTNNVWYYIYEDGSLAKSEYIKGYWLNANGLWTYKYKASWKHNKIGWWYGDSTGWYAKNTIFKIDNKLYGFNKQGYMMIGLNKIEKNYYYFESDGHALIDTEKVIDDKTYTFNSEGICTNIE